MAVRHLLQELGVDENRLFRWRLEHKLVQAIVLAHYCRDLVPPTRGLCRELCGSAAADARRRIDALCDAGGLIKPTLGESSREKHRRTYPDAVLQELARHAPECDGAHPLIDERFLVQTRVPIDREYRVHSLEDRVIPDLTFLRADPLATSREGRRAANQFVEHLLDALPDGLVKDGFYGWDVTADREGRWRVIEANPAGCHPVFRRGFQCSGFLQDRYWGPPAIALLLCFVRERYGAEVRIVLDADAVDASCHETYWWIARCQELLDLTRLDRAGENASIEKDDEPVLSGLFAADSPEQNFFLWGLAEYKTAQARSTLRLRRDGTS